MIDVYPVTIIKSRYQGSYEGAVWVAFNDEAGSEWIGRALGDDLSCGDFFRNIENKKMDMKNSFNHKLFCGRGKTPEMAYNDLVSKIKE